jgi:small conductance mechanosensitive channel
MLRYFFVDITGKVLWVIVLMIGLQRLGLDIAPLVAGLGVTGFIFGFAFKDSLSNLASGIMILLNQPFKIGDFVEISGTMGSVKSMNLMATELATPDNKKITIPNSSVWGNTITNFSANDTRRVDMIFGIGYGDDIQKAKDIITEVLKNNDKVLPEPEPLIEVKSLSDSSVDFTVRPWTKSSDYWKLYYEVTRKVKEEFDKNGISIPFPQMDVHVSKE